MAPPIMSFGRTSVVGWSPSSTSLSSSNSTSPSPYLATGTVSGALDDSFSSESLLEIWQPFNSSSSSSSESLEPIARVNASARFNRIAWGSHGVSTQERPLGIIAGGLENGNVALWDPSIAIHHQGHDPLITRFETHSGPVRGLDFSSAQANLLASGATNGEIFIYDLTTPNNKPFSPGPRSRSLDTITSLSWNPSVVHILASGSNSGYTVVWDLKSKREITALSYAGAGPTGLGAAGFGAFGGGGQGGVFGGSQPGSSGVGGLGGVSSVKWHPENPTKLVTASDDDHSPVILLWDLRNWKEPERVLRGHEKGILSVAWCKDDSDLIISSGKDGRTIGWSASTGEIVAEVAPSSNWAFDTAFCPRNPSIISTASLDGTVALHSLQSTNVSSDPATSTAEPISSSSNPFDSSSVFEQAISANAANYPTKSLTHAPKWLRRPASVAFGFGGKLIHIHHDRIPLNAPGGGGYSAPRVEIKKFVTSQPIVERAQKLEQASTGQTEGGLAAFCDERTAELEREGGERGEVESWKLLKTLFHAAAGGKASQNREQLVELLGYDKEGVKERIDQVVEKFRKEGKTFFENSQQPQSQPPAQSPQNEEPSEQQDPLSVQENGGGNDSSSTVTNNETSLFGESSGGTGDDFFSQIGAGIQNRLSALPERLLSGGKEGGGSQDGFNSAAATIGSASSIASLNLKPSTFKMYNPSSTRGGGDDVDRLITQALVVGDFTSAVSLALATDRFADALLFALRGGSELLAQTQSTYFARAQQNTPNSGSTAYLRILESVTMNDLSDIVQNADLADWIEVFVLLCTFAAQEEEFSSLVEQLGQRLEYQFQLVRGSPDPSQADDWRKNAILCYLAAGKLEKVVGVWVGQMKEEEEALKSRLGGTASASASFEAHARALQDFVEKVQVFQHAVGYVDVDLQTPTQSSTAADLGARTYKLASLYERYVEYAELLAEQGLTQLALKYINLTPGDFEGTKPESSGPALARERLLKASGQYRSAGGVSYGRSIQQQQPISNRYASAYGGAAQQQPNLANSTRSAYNPYSAPPVAATASTSSNVGSYNPYAAPPSQPLPGVQPAVAPSPYAPSNSYAPAPTAADNPYAPPPSSTTSLPPNPYAVAKPPVAASNPASFAPAFPTQVNDPYAPTGTPGSGLPAPPAIREASPNFANRQPVAASAPPPPRAKPDQGWNDAPILSRKSTPAAGATSASSGKVQAITSPFPNMSPTPSTSYGALPGQAVPPPPPSRGSNRTPAPPGASGVPPPPMTNSRFVPPPPPSTQQQQSMVPQQQQQQQQQPTVAVPPPPPTTNYAPPPPKMNSNYAPPPPASSSATNQYAPPAPTANNINNSPYAPPPPAQSQNNSGMNGSQPPPPRSGFPAAPPPRVGTPGNGNAFRAPPPPRSTATPPPGAPNFPRPPSAGANRAPFAPMTSSIGTSVPPVPPQGPHSQQFQSRPPPPPQQQQQTQQSPIPSQNQFAAPPPPPQMRSNQPPPPPMQGNGSLQSNSAPPPPPPAQAARPEPPKLKYPPGDRSHIPEKNRPILDILTLELRRLRQTTPPQQAKMINETEKRLNMLFDLINCEALLEPSTEKVLEICKAIEARNQALALDLHLSMLTTSNDVAPFQAALKLVIQRLS